MNQLRHCPRELSNTTGLESVQIEPGEQSKESDDTSTAIDDDFMINEDTTVLVGEEPTTDDLVEDSIVDTHLEQSPAVKVLAWDLTNSVF